MYDFRTYFAFETTGGLRNPALTRVLNLSGVDDIFQSAASQGMRSNLTNSVSIVSVRSRNFL